MNIRAITEDDYPVIAEWFSAMQWPLPPVDNLIPKNEGFMIEYLGTPMACGFLYLSGTSKGTLAWTATNQKMPKQLQDEAIDKLIKAVKEATSHMKPRVNLIVDYTKSEAFAERLKKHGFKVSPNWFRCTWVRGSSEDPTA